MDKQYVFIAQTPITSLVHSSTHIVYSNGDCMHHRVCSMDTSSPGAGGSNERHGIRQTQKKAMEKIVQSQCRTHCRQEISMSISPPTKIISDMLWTKQDHLHVEMSVCSLHFCAVFHLRVDSRLKQGPFTSRSRQVNF